MSRAYRIKVGESLSRVLSTEDAVSTQIEILPVLPEESMRRLLAEELKKRGFAEQGDRLVRDSDGIVAEVDPATGEVCIRASDSDRVDLKEERTGTFVDDWGPSQKQLERALQDELKRSLEKQADERERELRKNVTDRLERELPDILRELDQVSNRTIGEALKIKARELGDVKEIVEDENSGSLKIVLDV